MIKGTAFSTFLMHQYQIENQSLSGAEYVKNILEAINEQHQKSFAGIGAFAYFTASKMHDFPSSAAGMLKEIDSIFNYASNNLANNRHMVQEDLQDLNDAFKDVFMVEVKVLVNVMDHQEHFHEQTKKLMPNQSVEKQHTHDKLESEYNELVAKLNMDDKLYERLLNA